MFSLNHFLKRKNHMAKKYVFDIDVIDKDDTGQPIVEHQSGIVADSVETLHRIYGACDQQIRITNQRPVATDTQSSKTAVTQQAVEPAVAEMQQTAVKAVQTHAESAAADKPVDKPADKQNDETAQPKANYVEVAGIKLKIVGTEIYQKQWIKASNDESNCIRIVSDSTNKIVNMNGKHVEIEKWIKVNDMQTPIIDIK